MTASNIAPVQRISKNRENVHCGSKNRPKKPNLVNQPLKRNRLFTLITRKAGQIQIQSPRQKKVTIGRFKYRAPVQRISKNLANVHYGSKNRRFFFKCFTHEVGVRDKNPREESKKGIRKQSPREEVSYYYIVSLCSSTLLLCSLTLLLCSFTLLLCSFTLLLCSSTLLPFSSYTLFLSSYTLRKSPYTLQNPFTFTFCTIF